MISVVTIVHALFLKIEECYMQSSRNTITLAYSLEVCFHSFFTGVAQN
jgi:hypothetical protein